MATPSLPQDKANHILGGILVALVTAVLMRVTQLDAYMHPTHAGLISASAFGAGKEAVDYVSNKRAGMPKHGVEVLDALATAGGGVIVWGSSLLA
jgi:hypothetical protein